MCFAAPRATPTPALPAPIPEPPRLMDQTQTAARDSATLRARQMRGSASTIKAMDSMSSGGIGLGKTLLGQ